MIFHPQGYPIKVDWTGCLPHECRHGNNTDVLKWITSKIPFGLLTFESGTMNCEADVKFDTGAIVASVYLGLVALLVVIGEDLIVNSG
jgi:hypothetical protein